jgi:hypothetical protein
MENFNINFPKNDVKIAENRRLLSDAEYVINSMWEKSMDVSDLPLSIDSSYQAWGEDLENRKEDFARILFKKARDEHGKEKLRYAQTLKRLVILIGDSQSEALLKKLLTNKDAIFELYKQAEKEVSSEQPKTERAKGKIKRKIDRILGRDDDFGEHLK